MIDLVSALSDRSFRTSRMVFGGVNVLLCGDLSSFNSRLQQVDLLLLLTGVKSCRT
jgi:hypothetical protein